MFSLLFVTAVATTFAQEVSLKEREKQAAFDPAYNTYSRKKTAYVTLKDGTKLEGLVAGLDRKKGQIRGIEFKLEGEKKKKEIAASEIADLYMAPAGLDKLQKQNDFFNDATKWGKSDASQYISKGYTLYTNQTISLKNKKDEMELLMQVVNPRYNQVIEVFSDPFAKETASFGVGSMKLAGGIAKSYYVKKGDQVIWLTKANFDDYWEMLFMDNDKFKEKYGDGKYKWSLLGVYILDYTEFTLE